MNTTTTAGSSGINGFFSTILQGAGDAIANTLSDVVPVWTAQQLGVQSTNQLANDTYNPAVETRETLEEGTAAEEDAGFLNWNWDKNITNQGISLPQALLFVAGALGVGWIVGKIL